MLIDQVESEWADNSTIVAIADCFDINIGNLN